jgi:DNA-binding response OmpR family regulator
VPTPLARTQILFVEDDPGIRLTLPTILNQHGFEVTTSATVADALREINAHEFDALISDLNIGEPGDGFTVVSAMRRTQPRCITLILTGYPAFESALQAIRSQVDDYLVKPANIAQLVDLLRNKLSSPREVRNIPVQPFANFLQDHADDVVNRALARMKAQPRLAAIQLTDTERIEHIPGMLAEIVRQLQSIQPNDPTDEIFLEGVKHGKVRREQGYSQEMLVDDTRMLDSSTYAVVQDHLLEITLSNLVPDLSRFNDAIEAHLQAALRGFNSKKAA